MKLRPLGDNVIAIRREDKPSEIIETPAGYKKYSLYADVVATGPRASPLIKPGAVIVLRKTAGHEITTCHEGATSEFILVKEGLIDAIVKGK